MKSRSAYSVGVALGFATLILLLSACGTKVSCDDPNVVDQMLILSKRSVVDDLANQCSRSLFGRIPEVAPQCPITQSSSNAGCVSACRNWAAANVTAAADQIETLFKDETVSARRCRAVVRFNVAFEGGQLVKAKITYVAAQRMGRAQVALSN